MHLGVGNGELDRIVSDSDGEIRLGRVKLPRMGTISVVGDHK